MDEILAKLDNLKKFLNINNIKGPLTIQKTRRRHHRHPRPSLINLNNCFKDNNYQINHELIIEDESSDSKSMFEAHINNDITLKIPSLTKISKYLFDKNTIMIIDNIDNFPKESINKNGIGLLLVGLESWVSENNISYFLEQVPNFIKLKIKSNYNYDNFIENKIKINYIKFFYLKEKYCAFVNIQSLEQIKILGEYFLNPLKKNNPTINSKGEKIEFYYSYDLLTLTKSFWYGVVLRNLPRDCTDKSLFNFCENIIKDGIKYCLNPIYINHVFCSLVVCKEYEFAEKLCNRLNNYELVNKKIIKANFHPYFCKIRRKIENDKRFCQKGYYFEKDIEQSEICFNKSKSCADLLSSEKFNNNSINNDKTENNNIEENNEKLKTNEISNNNEEKNKNVKKKNQLKGTSIKILQTLKNILDYKNKNKQLNKKNLTETTKNNSNKSLNLISLKSNDIPESNFNDKNIEKRQELDDSISNNGRTTKKEGKENTIENNYSQKELEYYTYNFPDKSFFDNLNKEKENEFLLNKSMDNSNHFETSFLNNLNPYDYSKNNNYYDYNGKRELRNHTISSSYYEEEKSYILKNGNYKDYGSQYFNIINNKYYDYEEHYKYGNESYIESRNHYKYKEMEIYNEDDDYCDNKSIAYYYNKYKNKYKDKYYCTKREKYNNSYWDTKYEHNEIERISNKKYIKLKNGLLNNNYNINKKYNKKIKSLSQFKSIMRLNKQIEKDIIKDLKINKLYLKNMRVYDYHMLEGELKYDEIDEIIDKEKNKYIKNFLGKKININDNIDNFK